jgi:glycosyl transferase family 2
VGRFQLETCRWRRPSPVPARQVCLSPIVRAGPWGVMDHQCWQCPIRDHIDQEAPAAAVGGAGAIRHLIYHLYPVGQVWRWNLEELRRRMSLFQGRRLVAVAVGPETASAEEVRAELHGLDVEVHEFANNPVLKEMATYPWLLEQLSRYTSSGDCHYYGHAKGVTSESWGAGVRRWTSSMYEALLDHWPACSRALQDHVAVGIWQRLWEKAHGGKSHWHYSGSHRWVRNADLFSRDWRTMDQAWTGAETHPGIHFGQREAACLYGAFSTQDIGLYMEEEWRRTAEGQRQAWLLAHAGDHQVPLLLTVILTAHRQAELVHEAIASCRAQTTDCWQVLVVDSGQLAAAGAYDRYADDARISVMLTGETEEHPAGVGRQAWAINEAWARGRVRGDLVVHLCDDDRLAPTWAAACLKAARDNPAWQAWYGPAERVALRPDGALQHFSPLTTVGVGTAANSLRCRVDGMQVCHRRSVRVPWPEDPAIRHHADGHWMDALAAVTPIHPVQELVGQHRHTPLSTFTRSTP